MNKSWGTKGNNSGNTGSKWGSKGTTSNTNTTQTATGSKWGKGNTAGSSSTTAATAQRHVTSGTEWNPKNLQQKDIVETLHLPSSVEIPFAPSQYEETQKNGNKERFEVHNIIYFGMFNHINTTILRYNDYIKKGGIKIHDWDRSQQTQKTATTTTSTLTKTPTTGKTSTFGGLGAQSLGQQEVSPFTLLKGDFGDMNILKNQSILRIEDLAQNQFYDAPEQNEADKAPYPELDPNSIKRAAETRQYTVSYYKQLRKFTPRGLNSKDKTLFEEAKRVPQKSQISEERYKLFNTLSFKKPKEQSLPKNTPSDRSGRSSTFRQYSSPRDHSQYTEPTLKIVSETNKIGFRSYTISLPSTRSRSESSAQGARTIRSATITAIFPCIPSELIDQIEMKSDISSKLEITLPNDFEKLFINLRIPIQGFEPDRISNIMDAINNNSREVNLSELDINQPSGTFQGRATIIPNNQENDIQKFLVISGYLINHNNATIGEFLCIFTIHFRESNEKNKDEDSIIDVSFVKK